MLKQIKPEKEFIDLQRQLKIPPNLHLKKWGQKSPLKKKGDVENPIPTPQILTPEKDEHGNDKLLCISLNPGRALNMGDKDFLLIANSLNKEMTPVFQKEFPHLDGTNGKPRIDLSLIQYFVMTNTHLGMVAVCSHIKKTLWEYANNQFVPKADMHVEWR